MSELNKKFVCTPALIADNKANVACIGMLDQGQKCLNCIDENFKTNSSKLKIDRQNRNPDGILKPKQCQSFKPHCGEICRSLARSKQAWLRGYNVFLQLDISPNID